MITPQHLQILQHALGLDQYGLGTMYRNHFCAGGNDEQLCRELVEAGLMIRNATTALFPYYNCSVTDAGKQYVLTNSPRPAKLTRSQERYRKFLNADSGLTFHEWLQCKTESISRKDADGVEL